jgi:hypothetical protein
MISRADLVKETCVQPDGFVHYCVRLGMKEEGAVPSVMIFMHEVNGTGIHPVTEALRAAEDRIMERLYGPAEHLWDVAAGLTAVLRFVQEKYRAEYHASGQVILHEGASSEHIRPQWPPAYLAFRSQLMEAAFALGLRWASGQKFVPQTGGEMPEPQESFEPNQPNTKTP